MKFTHALFTLMIFTQVLTATVHHGDTYTVDGSGSVKVPFETKENIDKIKPVK